MNIPLETQYNRYIVGYADASFKWCVIGMAVGIAVGLFLGLAI